VKVGLFKEETQEHMPHEILAYVKSEPICSWHVRYAKNYRDALAHRIPPYVPPAVYLPVHQQEFEQLQQQRNRALMEDNTELALNLQAKLHEIGIIHPAFMHSFSGPMREIVLYPQIIADKRTVLKIISVVRPHLPVATNQGA
jgi:hypothetical protein